MHGDVTNNCYLYSGLNQFLSGCVQTFFKLFVLCVARPQSRQNYTLDLLLNDHVYHGAIESRGVFIQPISLGNIKVQYRGSGGVRRLDPLGVVLFEDGIKARCQCHRMTVAPDYTFAGTACFSKFWNVS